MKKVIFLIWKLGRYNLAEELKISPATLRKRCESPGMFTIDNMEKINELYEQHKED